MSDWTIAELGEAIRARRISSVEAVSDCLGRIEHWDGRLRAFITLDAEGALAAAKSLDEEIARGRVRGPLHGVPLAYKDLCHVGGLPTSCGTRTAAYFTAEHDATAVSRLRAAGAVTLGKLNMTELAMGPFGDNAHHGHAQNPWRLGRAPGGSSSGSGVAVAAGLALGALGTDTGGSIRLPSACCGITGLKPTYGRVSRAGVMPLSWSNDHVGPMARTVRDAALLLHAIAGRDRLDATSSRHSVPNYAVGLDRGIAGLRVAVPENFFFQGVDPEMADGVRGAIRVLETLGARIAEVRVPDPEIMNDVANIISRCESAAVHARLVRERPEEVQPVVRARLELGFRIAAYDYIQALRLRARLTRVFVRDVFAEADLLAAPVIPEPAPLLERVIEGAPEVVAQRQGRFSRLTRPFNGLGLPALALPCGWSADGLPLAFQVVGRPFDEATVLRAGHAYEQAAGWHRRRPALD
jgi:aspartyl-tRNA(Asn)/glutamyl-tRNA(Gln) amidotransferase subunit A